MMGEYRGSSEDIFALGHGLALDTPLRLRLRLRVGDSNMMTSSVGAASLEPITYVLR